MTFVVSRLCRDCVDGACLSVCPTDCILEHRPVGKESDLPNQLFINPDDCIDCNQCAPECPWEAIYPEGDLPDVFIEDLVLNAQTLKRPNEFRVPENIEAGRPSPDQVEDNQRKWGLLDDPARAVGAK